MRLNVQTDYALRLLMQLAVSGDEPVTIQEVADKYSISRNHLMKIAYILGRRGLIRTIRGRSGGLRLGRPAETIGVGEVVREMEPDLALVECFRPGGCNCLVQSVCRLRAVLADASAAFMAELDRHTLADLTRDNQELRLLIGA